MNTNLIQKYNVPGPRYTSYPTVPYWDTTTFTPLKWRDSVVNSFQKNHKRLSLYIHLPFCESLCTFCGCHKRITKRHEVEKPYIDSLLNEWQLYVNLFGATPVIQEIHLGGGTPTFFSPENLKSLINGIFKQAIRDEEVEFSFEGHPNNTGRAHLETLYNLGFRRVSYGVQDYNEGIQKAIHRIQPFEKVKRVTDQAREIGYTSVSHDLIFGLPFQTKEHILDTIVKTATLLPDRIAFYSYAHVPWIKGNGQRGFDENDIPNGVQKRELYEYGKKLLADVGYQEIGMDHFALKTDQLYRAMKEKSLHRNFMGYTTQKTSLLIGLGASSISDSWSSFAQNEKDIHAYKQLVNAGEIPVFKGHILSDHDLIIRRHILNLICGFETWWDVDSMKFEELERVLDSLEELEEDGLLNLVDNGIQITDQGKPFIRNICMAFDIYLGKNQPKSQLFSMTV